MGWSFRKSFRVAPGIRLNLSKGGAGLSGGIKGFRVGVGPRGTQVSAGRGGIYYRKQLGGGFGGLGASRRRSSILLTILVIAVAAILWYFFSARPAGTNLPSPSPTHRPAHSRTR